LTATAAIRFDLRRAPFATVTEGEQYATCVEMARWADGHGFSAVTISEHHGVDFVSAPAALAGVLLGATQRMHVMANALLVPLHDPVRLAEAVATLDLTSGGRFTFVAGLAYRHDEFRMAGVDRTRRGAITEEYLGVLRRAWTGDPFEWRGRTIVVRPTPTSAPEQLMWVGGSVRRSAERAARLRLPFFTMSTDPAVGEMYREECERVGYTTGFFVAPKGPLFVHVSEDPERTWDTIAPYAVYDVASYNSWQTADHDNVAASTATTAGELRASDLWQIVTPAECVELAGRYGTVALHPLMGGMPPALGWESLQLFVDKVMPRL
jgi:alkanesulfonate monooxygenase SsuD/methylene tetrahydromethanopterin reductase-like flavin-dependent oxidoreductase (luciferase family)